MSETADKKDTPQSGDSQTSSQEAYNELETKLQEAEKKYTYLYAEFENFKKRALREHMDLKKYGWEPLAKELILIIDNMERALSHASPETDKALLDGLQMIFKQFKTTLEKHGIRPIPVEDQNFDPHLHEAVAQEHSDAPQGQIIGQHATGYTFHGRLLRPARVIVSGGNKSE